MKLKQNSSSRKNSSSTDVPSKVTADLTPSRGEDIGFEEEAGARGLRKSKCDIAENKGGT